MHNFRFYFILLFFFGFIVHLSGQTGIDVQLSSYIDSVGNKKVKVEYLAIGNDFTDFQAYWRSQLITIAWKEQRNIKSTAPKPNEEVKILPNKFGFRGLFSKSESPIFFRPSDIGSIDDGYVYSAIYAEIDEPIQYVLLENKKRVVCELDIPDDWVLEKSVDGLNAISLRTAEFYDKDEQKIPYTFVPLITSASSKKSIWIGEQLISDSKKKIEP